MINMEEVLAIKAEMRELKEKSHKLDDQYRIKAQELLEKVLSCKEVLTETKWKLQGDRALESLNSKHKMISELLQNDYHCYYTMDGISLNFDDWDITIFFDTPEGLVKFIERTGIVLDVSSLKNKLESDRRDLKRLEDEIARIESLNKVGLGCDEIK